MKGFCNIVLAFIIGMTAGVAQAFSIMEVNFKGVRVQLVFMPESKSEGMAAVTKGVESIIPTKCIDKKASVCEGVNKEELRKEIRNLAKKEKVGVFGIHIKVPKDAYSGYK